MQIDIENLGTVVGMAVPVFGAVFWFGRLEGRVSEANREIAEMKETQEKQDAKLEKQSEKFNQLDNKMTKVDTGVAEVQKQMGTLFKKVDKLTETLLLSIGASRCDPTPPTPPSTDDT